MRFIKVATNSEVGFSHVKIMLSSFLTGTFPMKNKNSAIREKNLVNLNPAI